MLYGALFLVAGAVLLAITYGLVAQSLPKPVAARNAEIQLRAPGVNVRQLAVPQLPIKAFGTGGAFVYSAGASKGDFSVQLRQFNGKVTSAAKATIRRISATQLAQFQREARQLAARTKAQLDHQRSTELSALVTKSGLALGIMALVSIGLGWLMAGRALRPVRTMSARARRISEHNLHERLGLEGPNDELKELGDTVDGLLGRLETAFESQRRFVANASHELRTPITLERTLVEVALADPHASMSSMRDTCRRVLAASEQQERLIEALLTLARSQRGLERRERVDLGAVAGEAVRAIGSGAVRVESELGEALTVGDPALLERMIVNLLDNAVHYNEDHGWVRAWTGTIGGVPMLRVANTGPHIAPAEVPDLIEPFRRLNGNRSAHARGLGLGLSIVDAIATAHAATFRAMPRQEGGLEVEVQFSG